MCKFSQNFLNFNKVDILSDKKEQTLYKLSMDIMLIIILADHSSVQ